MDTITITFTEDEFNTLRDIFFNVQYENSMQSEKYVGIATHYILDLDYKYDGCTLQQAENCIKMINYKRDKMISIAEKFRNATINNKGE